MLYLGDTATSDLANQKEQAHPRGCSAVLPPATSCPLVTRLGMAHTRLDSVYRRFLAGHYTQHAFDAKRDYKDISGSVYTTTPCYYCGVPATAVDHTLPLIVYRELLAIGEPPDKRRLIVVPSCHECNSLLGDNFFPSLASRKKYVKRRLRSRYRFILRIPKWQEYEIRALGRNLQDYVRQGHDERERLHQRLAW